MSFVIANIVVLLVTFLGFQYLDALNREMESISTKSNRIALISDEVRMTSVAILKDQRRILMRQADDEVVDRLIAMTDALMVHLQNLHVLYSDPDAREVISRMSSYVDSLRLVLGKAQVFQRGGEGLESIEDLMDRILETFSEFQDVQYFENEMRNEQMNEVIKETKQKMMVTLIIGFLGTIVLGLVVPGKIALPFKKIKDAIRELQDCNFDVSIYYNQQDEIGEIAREMNKMIHGLKVFEELRTDRIAIEMRKFDALANIVRKPVLVADATGHIVYMNGRLYNILQVQSQDVIGKEMEESPVPGPIIECFELAIKRRSKIENQEVEFVLKSYDPEFDKELAVEEDRSAQSEESGSEGAQKRDVDQAVDHFFRGYATVIPIRGKESSLDYYLMVLSKEVVA